MPSHVDRVGPILCAQASSLYLSDAFTSNIWPWALLGLGALPSPPGHQNSSNKTAAN